MNAEINARKELEVKTSAELKVFKQKNKKLSSHNKVLKAAISEMTRFFQQLDQQNEASDRDNQVEGM